jgi:hypothetical protein
MICQACRNKITRNEWIRVTIDCMQGHPSKAEIDPDGPNQRWAICLDCVGLLDVCLRYLTDKEWRHEQADAL